jgi:hypothetical protein
VEKGLTYRNTSGTALGFAERKLFKVRTMLYTPHNEGSMLRSFNRMGLNSSKQNKPFSPSRAHSPMTGLAWEDSKAMRSLKSTSGIQFLNNH